MKKIFVTSAVFFLSLGFSYAQEVMDAYKFSKTELLGTARSAGMGGAMGAVGNDVSAIQVNPAGIGLYRGVNEILGTLDLSSVNMETNGNTQTKKTYFKFNNLAYVGSFYLGEDAVPFINVGFSYNRIKNFDNTYRLQGNNTGASIANIMADQANNGGYNTNDLSLDMNVIDKWQYNSWLALMGYNSFLISQNSAGKFIPLYSNTSYKYLYNREKGGINSYDFNVGTEIEKTLSLGLSFSVTDLSYSLFSDYNEEYDKHDNFMGLENFERTDGTGYQVSLGLIFKPVESFSLGVAYHSPTWYDMKRYSSAAFHFKTTDNNVTQEGTIYSMDNKGDAVFDYSFRTPDKWVFSLATAIKSGNRNFATISADYELTNFKNMRFSGADYNPQNQDIKDYFRLASTFRVGAEVAITPQFLARVGYAWQQAAAKDEVRDDNKNYPIYPTGSVTQYVFDGDTQYITWGLGYRFGNGFFTDLAFIYKNQTSKLYSSGVADAVNLKNNTYQGLMTIGYRFSSWR